MTFSLRTCTLIIFVLLSLAINASAQQSTDARAQAFPRVTIPGSEVRSLKSSNTGRSYDLYIHLPAGGAQNRAKKYPVLYVLDGQWDFKLLDSVYGGLLYDKFVPEMIIVGITYSGDNPNYDALRAMDYTPASESRNPGSGDAPKFLAFLKKELMPFIETNYKGDASKRVLMGSSLGGLFTLYAMFTEPGLFSGYVSASPAVPYGDRFAFKQEAEYASKHHELPARLFLSVGDIEGLTAPVKEFMQIVATRGYKGLKLETRVIEGERHSGNKPEAFNRGLRFVFQSE
jgi:predicted alpha/beta superfamily hydrolase